MMFCPRSLTNLFRVGVMRPGRARPAPGYELFLVRKPDASGWEPLMVRRPDHSGWDTLQVKKAHG